jgi:hypothetical protein
MRHLLRDSLGAVDAHYEAVFDGIQEELTGRTAKILASSATLSGYEKQSRVLYRRRARVFPQPGSAPGVSFWSKPTEKRMRRYLAIAPRGATIEFAIDRLLLNKFIEQGDRFVEPIPITLTSWCAERTGTKRDEAVVRSWTGSHAVCLHAPIKACRLRRRSHPFTASA